MAKAPDKMAKTKDGAIMTFPIPDAALTSHTAIVGKTGAGKSTTAKGIVEHLVGQGGRVCILDPIKSDWWGLTSSADGKKAGLPFYILGGPRGHVPLHPANGKAIAEIVANGELPLSILDMADFPAGGVAKFFIEFAPTLLRRMRGVVHLVMEEAHEFAPKERAGFGDENLQIHHAKRLATAGRSRGVRLIVLTQRTQALHNAILGSCETMIAHRLTAPADQKPVTDWLKANLEKDKAAEIAGSMASLKTGTAWVCSGEAQFFKLVQFPRIKTYDNSATPTGDADANEIRTAKVDIDRLRSLMAVKDPVLPLTSTKVEKSNIPDQRQLAAAREEGGMAVRASISALLDAQHAQSFAMGAEWARGAAVLHLKGMPANADPMPSRKPLPRIAATNIRVGEPVRIDGQAVSSVRPPPSNHRQAPSKAPKAPSNGVITAPQATMLRALAWWKEMGHTKPSRPQVAALAGWKVTAGHLKNVAGTLRSAGLIEYPEDGRISLTEAGFNAAPEPDMGATLLDGLRAALSAPQRTVLNALLPHRRQSREELSEKVGWDAAAGHLKNILGAMRSMQIVDYPAKGEVELQEWVK